MYNPNLPNNGLGLYQNLSSQPYASLPTAANVQSSFQIPQVSGENGAKAYTKLFLDQLQSIGVTKLQ